MDKGAHFYKCDFQVHTPRDERWNGEGAVSKSERISYAQDFIRACREKSLNAVAITDHHDFCLFPFIKAAAEQETDESGNIVSIEDRIVVFPGLELSLCLPSCQAILILDADFPCELLPNILTKLSIIPNSDTEPKTAHVERITGNVVNGLQALYTLLNSLEYLRGRFIILPNVSDGGSHTLLRTGGFYDQYINMPCVGGYVDGSVDKLGTGNLSILQGQSAQYGNKSIAVIQTSDCRRRDFSTLGSCSSWIKWSMPTAEAIRQVCLSKESRLSNEEPTIPQIWIESIIVTDSKFMGPVALNLNPQYNALIGGRGTGKSTILEYIRWALCDQIKYDLTDSSVQNKRQSLVENTLSQIGNIQVNLSINGVRHIVQRRIDNIIALKIGDNGYVQCTPTDITKLISIQAYSQKQLSNVSVKEEELQRFVNLPIQKKLSALDEEIEKVNVGLKQSYSNVYVKKSIINEIKNLRYEEDSLLMQSEKVKEGIKNLSPENQNIIDQHKFYNLLQSKIEGWNNEISQISEQIHSIKTIINEKVSDDDQINFSVLNESYHAMHEILTFAYKNFQSNLFNAFKVFNENISDYQSEVTTWSGELQIHKESYQSITDELEHNKLAFEQLEKFQIRIDEIDKLITQKNLDLKKYSNVENEYKTFLQQWIDLYTKKRNMIDEECERLNTFSDGLINAQVDKCMDLAKIKLSIKSLVEGAHVNDAKIDNLCDAIKLSDNCIKTWVNVLQEFELLAGADVQDKKSLERINTQILLNCQFKKEIERIAEKLTTDKWINISTEPLIFKPEFRYVADKKTGDNIKFEDASAGQQATALLTILLNQDGLPLIIDQPEDDIDNKSIKNIIEAIWKAKHKRQIIFASHNANIVVNGDAELVICCDYIENMSQTKGHIKLQGAIDEFVIKEEITDIMEGGERAFKLRKEKYGF